MAKLTIGQLARRAEVHVQTIRYNERRGLMAEPPRRASGYREYGQDDVARIRFIRHAKDLGFSLKEISDLLLLRVDPVTTCGDVKRRAEVKIAEIDEKMRSLERMKVAVAKLAESCRGRGPTSECPILEALNASEIENYRY